MRVGDWFGVEVFCSIKGTVHVLRDNFALQRFSDGRTSPSDAFLLTDVIGKCREKERYE